MDKGKVEGKAEEKYRTIKNMILEGLETSFICRITETTTEYVDTIRMEIE